MKFWKSRLESPASLFEFSINLISMAATTLFRDILTRFTVHLNSLILCSPIQSRRHDGYVISSKICYKNINYYAHNDGILFLVLDRTSECYISDGFSACDQLKITIMIARAVVSKSHKPVCGFLFESWISILLWLKYHYQYQNRARRDQIARALLQMWW